MFENAPKTGSGENMPTPESNKNMDKIESDKNIIESESNENISKPESHEIREFNEEEKKLIGELMAMRLSGTENQEIKESLLRWTKEQEKHANEINTSRANIEFDLRRAKLYKAAGYLEEAWDSLNAVCDAAGQEGADDLYNKAQAMMDEIDTRA